MLPTKAYAAVSIASPLEPFEIQRREPGPEDVLFEILYCGICHTDIHMTSGEFPNSIFPMVPGHEIVGKVLKTGSAVTRFKAGETVAVGCMVDSCRTCSECKSGNEHFCDQMVATYNAYELDGKTLTYGGYSTQMTVDQNYLLKVPSNLDPAGAAPLLCAGITTYSPLRHWKVGKGSQVAVIGLGGLGHLAVKLANAMGADVTVFSTSESKKADATRLGAKDFTISKDPEVFSQLAGKFDLILNTVSANIEYDPYINTLKRDGSLVILGVPDGLLSINAMGLLYKRRSIAASLIGSIAETQEMLDFCGKHNITSDIELININQVNEAYKRILKSNVRYRFVIDLASLR